MKAIRHGMVPAGITKGSGVSAASIGVMVAVALSLPPVTFVVRRSDHRCHRMRASSRGIATPSHRGITRAV